MLLHWKGLVPHASEHVGFLVYMLDDDDEDKATVQLDKHYQHGGGWQPFEGFTLRDDDSIKYPGDPAYKPVARTKLRDETIVVYEHGWVAVIQPDRSYEICRMD
jgi:hypothetical protein